MLTLKNTFKIGSLKAIGKCGMIKYAKFKANVKELLNL
jgi:hypothetical protein